jgi:hypothetical protein
MLVAEEERLDLLLMNNAVTPFYPDCHDPWEPANFEPSRRVGPNTLARRAGATGSVPPGFQISGAPTL